MEKKPKARYMERLKNHPGLPVAAILTPSFLAAGFMNKNPWYGVTAGLFFSIVVWAAVLVSNRD